MLDQYCSTWIEVESYFCLLIHHSYHQIVSLSLSDAVCESVKEYGGV